MDLSDLVAGQSRSALVPVRRLRNPFLAELRKSHESGECVALPPVATSEVKRVYAALRRAAVLTDLGVHIRREETPAGVVIRYQAKPRAVHKREAS